MRNLTRLRLILVDLSGLMKNKTHLKQNVLFFINQNCANIMTLSSSAHNRNNRRASEGEYQVKNAYRVEYVSLCGFIAGPNYWGLFRLILVIFTNISMTFSQRLIILREVSKISRKKRLVIPVTLKKIYI